MSMQLNDLFDYDVLEDNALKSLKISAGRLLNDIHNNSNETYSNLWPSLSSIDTPSDCTLRLIPLNRLGAPEGKSKSSVFVAYFICNSCWPSKPLVVKFAIPDEKRDSCSKEYDDYRSVSSYLEHNAEGFAKPLAMHPGNEEQPYSVLWSPFVSSADTWGDEVDKQRLSLGFEDIWTLLTSDDKLKEVSTYLQFVYKLLGPMHKKAGHAKRNNRDYKTEYHRYLRDLLTDEWPKTWIDCWGGGEEKTASDFGVQWPNPFNTLKNILDLNHDFYCGAIHGDLHPKNIVLSNKIPRIIDFGWAEDNAHIAKDFVLFECNVRFVTLPSSIAFDDVNYFAAQLSFAEVESFAPSSTLQSRCSLIKILRTQAQKALPDDTNWDMEYVIPLFIVAFGLLKFCNDFHSNISARLHILHLSKYITESVLK